MVLFSDWNKAKLSGIKTSILTIVNTQMKIRIKLIPLAFAKSGMKLANPILGDNGRVLLTKGAELSDNLLVSLHARNVSSISIQEEDTRNEEELSIERGKITRHIDEMFLSAPPDSNLQSLHHLILDYRLDPHL